MYLITKLMVFVLIFAILIVIREAFNFGLALFSNDAQSKYKPGTGRLILLGIALSYIFTIIFTGFRIL